MIHPAQRICASEKFLYFAISQTLYKYEISTTDISELWTADAINESEKHRNISHRAVTEMSIYENYLVWFGEDKFLRVIDLQSGSQLSQRELCKRACCLSVEDGVIVVGDKFGDVYRYPMLVSQEDEANEAKTDGSMAAKSTDKTEQQGSAPESAESSFRLPILGHVSMLTSVVLTPPVDGKRLVVSADRDEHIRVSSFPDGYNIHCYCLGHTQFISTLLITEDGKALISAGGDDYLAFWDCQSGKLLKRCNMKDAVDMAEKENVGFAVLKLVQIRETSLLVVLVESLQTMFVYDLNSDAEKALYTIEILGPAMDISTIGSRLWVSYDTARSTDLDKAQNFDCFEMSDKSATRVDLTSLNSACRHEVEKVEYTTHRADLMRKRSKAELEAARSTQGRSKRPAQEGPVDKALLEEIEADKLASGISGKKLKVGGET